MAFNEFQWKNYLKSGGSEIVRRLEHLISGDDLDDYISLISELVSFYLPDKETCHEIELSLREYKEASANGNLDIGEMTADGAVVEGEEIPFACQSIAYVDYCQACKVSPEEKMKMKMFFLTINRLDIDSSAYAHEYPEECIPYYFVMAFHIVEAIAREFDIVLPDIPGKVSYTDRYFYYSELCNVFNRFRRTQGWTPAELWAFLYDYAPKVISADEYVWKDLPSPRAVYVFGLPGEIADSQWKDGEILAAQGSEEMQPGDIGLLYCWHPAKCFTSVWRAVSPGCNDPLFSHYRYVYYGKPQCIPHVGYKTFSTDPVLKETSLAKTSMSKMDGGRLKPSEYMRLLEVAAQQGAVPDSVPRMELKESFADGETFDVERDVEIKLLEPLLLRLGWTPADWCRQMPIRIGRGINKFPDYVVNPVYDLNRPSGEIVLEAKLTIPTIKQLEHDKGQAATYSRLLNAHWAVLVAKEGIWVSSAEQDYLTYQTWSWADLENADRFGEVQRLIGKRARSSSPRKKHR